MLQSGSDGGGVLNQAVWEESKRAPQLAQGKKNAVTCGKQCGFLSWRRSSATATCCLCRSCLRLLCPWSGGEAGRPRPSSTRHGNSWEGHLRSRRCGRTTFGCVCKQEASRRRREKNRKVPHRWTPLLQRGRDDGNKSASRDISFAGGLHNCPSSWQPARHPSEKRARHVKRISTGMPSDGSGGTD